MGSRRVVWAPPLLASAKLMLSQSRVVQHVLFVFVCLFVLLLSSDPIPSGSAAKRITTCSSSSRPRQLLLFPNAERVLWQCGSFMAVRHSLFSLLLPEQGYSFIFGILRVVIPSLLAAGHREDGHLIALAQSRVTNITSETIYPPLFYQYIAPWQNQPASNYRLKGRRKKCHCLDAVRLGIIFFSP